MTTPQMLKWHVSMNVKVDGQNFCAEGNIEAETKEQAEQIMFDRYKNTYECSSPNALQVSEF